MAKIKKAKLIQLQKKLKTDDKIGQQYGITRQAVYQLRIKYGIEAVVDKNAKRNQEIIKANKAGKSGRALAEEFKLSVSQTCRIIERSKGGKKKVTKTKATKKKPAKKKAAKKKVVKKVPAKKKVVKKATKKKVAKKKK